MLMNNLPHTHLQFLQTPQSHYVYVASDLHEVISNTNGALSLYAWLYNNYTDYKKAGKIDIYKDIVSKWLTSLATEDIDAIKKIIHEQHEYYHTIKHSINHARQDDEFINQQYGAASFLFNITNWRDQKLKVPSDTTHQPVATTKHTTSHIIPSTIKHQWHGWPTQRTPETA